MKIHFVCTGNLCRSPMAEVLLRKLAHDKGADVSVSSSGTWAVPGEPATDGAVRAMSERGIDLSAHLSQPFTAELGREADLIVAMTSVHLREIEAELPGATQKTRLLKEIAELAPAEATTPAARLDALLQAERPVWVRALDLDDPMGLPFHAYATCANQLERGIERLLGSLA